MSSRSRVDSDAVLDAALQYAARGWAVFPVWEDKSPATWHGFKDAATDAARVRELFARYPASGVGIRTGASSGLVVLDVDEEKDGGDTLWELETQHGRLPDTVEVLTGGGGRHLYFRHPGGEVRNSAEKLGPGLDVRGDGGYVVAPPSPHPSGRRYEWEASGHPDDVGLAPLPAWMQPPPAEAVLERGAPLENVIPEGRRNATLASLAGTMRRRGMGRAAIEAALLVENHGRCRPPLPDSEVAAIAASVARYDAEESIGAVAVEASPFELVTARELCELPDPPVSDELLGPLLVRGARTVLGAHTGEGKTTLALQLVQAVVMQREFLDWCGRGGRALVIDAEQGLRTIKRRLREAGLERSDEVDYLRVPDGLALDADGGDVARLEALLESGDYALVAADPLYKLHRGDSNEERHAVDLMRRLDQWRSRFGFALLMMVHRRKVQPSASGFSIDDLFGSGAYLRGAEVVLGLKRPSPGYARLYFFKDRDGDLPVGETWGLLFDRDDGFRRDPDDGKPKETARDKVRERLEAQPGLTLEQLAAATGVSERTVRKALTDLAAEHDTGKHGKKLWRLPAGDADEQ